MVRRDDRADRMDTISKSTATKLRRTAKVHDQSNNQMATNRGTGTQDKNKERGRMPILQRIRGYPTHIHMQKEKTMEKNVLRQTEQNNDENEDKTNASKRNNGTSKRMVRHENDIS